MERLVRILRWSITLLCALLFLCTTILYLRSLRHLDEFHIYCPMSYRSIWSVEGRFYLFLWKAPTQYWSNVGMGWGGGDLTRLNYNVPISHKLGPFGYNLTSSTNSAAVRATGRIIMLPHWFVLLLTAIAPAAAIRRFVKHRSARFRAANGLCVRCGYDNRATPDRCPECGLEKSPVAVAGS